MAIVQSEHDEQQEGGHTISLDILETLMGKLLK
jgi:hypothetical protein